MWSREELTYCSNVHPCASFDELISTIKRVENVRKIRNSVSMGAGLWISNDISLELQDTKKLIHFINALSDANLSLFSLNGFPYNNFHTDVVKESVYTPDWSDKQRLTYTARLATILSQILPIDQNIGTISTLPLGFKKFWNEEHFERALENIFLLCQHLGEIFRTTKKRIIVCLEMEPGCVLESTPEIIDFFRSRAPEYFKKNKLPMEIFERHVGLCFDVCHQAVLFENCYDSLVSLAQHNIPIGKIQVSSALEIHNQDIKTTRSALLDFAEPKYLHQTFTLNNDSAYGITDLPCAFKDDILINSNTWRIHYHIPIQMKKLEGYNLGTTQASILDTLNFLRDNPKIHPHIEVETYTWHVLPEKIRPRDDEQLQICLSNELNWLENTMSDIGLIK